MLMPEILTVFRLLEKVRVISKRDKKKDLFPWLTSLCNNIHFFFFLTEVLQWP